MLVFLEHTQKFDRLVLANFLPVISLLINFSTILAVQKKESITNAAVQKCPSECSCEINSLSKRAVVCSDALFDSIPIKEIDSRIQVRIIHKPIESQAN